MVRLRQYIQGLDICIQCCDMEQVGAFEAWKFAILELPVKQQLQNLVAVVGNRCG